MMTCLEHKQQLYSPLIEYIDFFFFSGRIKQLKENITPFVQNVGRKISQKCNLYFSCEIGLRYKVVPHDTEKEINVFPKPKKHIIKEN